MTGFEHLGKVDISKIDHVEKRSLREWPASKISHFENG